jgi:hypothetical protein
MVRSMAAGSGALWALAVADAAVSAIRQARHRAPKLSKRIEMWHPATIQCTHRPRHTPVMIKKFQALQRTR